MSEARQEPNAPDDASPDARLELLKQGIEAFNRGDAEPALALFAADVECYVAPGLINSGTYRGHDGYLEMITAWGEAWGSVTVEVLGAEDLPGGNLLVEVRQQAVGAESGVPVQMTLFWLFQFVDGSVVRFHLYSTRAESLAAIEGE